MEDNAWIWILFVFIVYFIVLIGIAVFRSRKMDDMSDYVLGGRKMGAFTSALSAGSSGTMPRRLATTFSEPAKNRRRNYPLTELLGVRA